MGKLKSHEFTSENMKSYADACINLAMDMVDYKFDTLLIPSRGAVPIFLGSVFALNSMGRISDIYPNLAERFTAPQSIRQGILPRPRNKTIENEIEILPYPLTADVNMTRYEKRADTTYYSKQMREFSVKVLKNFFKKPYERIEDPYFRFFSHLLSKIENRENLALEYATYPQVKNLALIDTVISGKAATTILDAFGEEGIQPISFLVVDRNGDKVRKEYQNELGYKKQNCGEEYYKFKKIFGRTIKKETKIDRTKNKFYDVIRLFTEDTGCALQGVSATTYPEIMLKGNSEFFKLTDGSIGLNKLGAGTWRAVPRERNHKRVFYSFINTLKKAIEYQCESLIGDNKADIQKKEKIFENKRKNLVDLLKKTDLPEVTIENITQYYPEYKKEHIRDVYESSAHVLQLAFTDKFTNNFIEEFKRDLEQRKNLEAILK